MSKTVDVQTNFLKFGGFWTATAPTVSAPSHYAYVTVVAIATDGNIRIDRIAVQYMQTVAK